MVSIIVIYPRRSNTSPHGWTQKAAALIRTHGVCDFTVPVFGGTRTEHHRQETASRVDLIRQTHCGKPCAIERKPMPIGATLSCPLISAARTISASWSKATSETANSLQ